MTTRLLEVTTSERILLVVVELAPRRATRRFAFVPRQHWTVADEAAELRDLVTSCRGEIIGEIRCRRVEPTPTFVIGRGKVEEIAAAAQAAAIHCVVFNIELSPAQQRNLEDIIGLKTIDRTQLILDIFAQRARSQEGKIQVELAQLAYLLPRLTGQGVLLSRLGGGIGTRGPGEQKLEVDRRRIRSRITHLDRALDAVTRRRAATRRKRTERQVPTVALVGYTNAGKTTLFNALTAAAAPAESRLFTTLDPLARRLTLPNRQTVILLDTVGFLHRLPHHVIDAFKATLEETASADLLLCVVDASDPLALERGEAVCEVLRALQVERTPQLFVFNKLDVLEDPARLRQLERTFGAGVAVSATTGQGVPALLEQLVRLLGERSIVGTLVIPANRYALIERLYQEGEVLTLTYEQEGYVVEGRIPVSIKWLYEPYLRS